MKLPSKTQLQKVGLGLILGASACVLAGIWLESAKFGLTGALLALGGVVSLMASMDIMED